MGSISRFHPDFQLVGQLGFFDLLLQTSSSGAPSGLSGQLDLNIAPSVGDARKLFFADFVSAMASAQITTTQSAHLDLAATFGFDFEKDATGRYVERSNFPSLTSDFVVDWDLAAPTAPHVSFDHLKLNFGQLINEFLDPIIHPIQQVLVPLKPLIDFISTPLPLLSGFGKDVTLIDLAAYFGGEGAAEAADFIDSVGEISRIVALIGHADEGLVLDLGNFSFGATDLRHARGDGPNALPTQFSGLDDPAFQALLGVSALNSADQIRSQPGAGQFDQVAPRNNSSGFTIPILDDPKSIIGMMFGINVELVHYKPPSVLLSVKYEFPSILIWATPPVDLTLGVFGQFELHMGIGYDSSGFRGIPEVA